MSLGELLRSPFQLIGVEADLDEAVQTGLRCLRGLATDYPKRPALLTEVAATLMVRFKRCTDTIDLGLAIEHFTEAAPLVPVEDPLRGPVLSGLGTAFLARFETRGEIQDLEDAVARLLIVSERRPAETLAPHGAIAGCPRVGRGPVGQRPLRLLRVRWVRWVTASVVPRTRSTPAPVRVHVAAASLPE